MASSPTTEHTTDEKVRQQRDRLSHEDAAAWDEYGAAVRRDAPRRVRKTLFERAMKTLDAIGVFETEQRGVS